MNEFKQLIQKSYVEDKDTIFETCRWLTKNSPSSNIWYYKDGFFRVKVEREDYDSYMDFIENLIGCSYCYLMNATGITLMMSLSTLYRKLV